jgi:hypothetical protein
MADFLNLWPYAPQGFVSEQDEADMYYRSILCNEAVVGLSYAQNVCFSADPYVSDEKYGGDSFQYIPTEVQVASAIALRNMATAGELPVQNNAPGMTQLLQSLYQRTSEFWQQIRQASGTGW